jgi:hypothetical protein
LDSISDSGPDRVYTVFVDSGILDTDVGIDFDGKSYINLVGRGMGVSVIRATGSWFTNVANGTLDDGYFIDAIGSHDLTFRGIGIDARSQEPPGTVWTFGQIVGGLVVDGNKILIDSSEIQGLTNGFWEQIGEPSNLIEVFNSKIRAVGLAVQARKSIWHIFSSDLKAIEDSSSQIVLIGEVVGLQVQNAANTTVWGSHIHAESSLTHTNGVAAVFENMITGSTLNIVGSQLHVKINAAQTSNRKMSAYYLGGTAGKVNLIGTDLVYESIASLGQGHLGGIGFVGNSSQHEINLVGVNIFDRGGSGGTVRGDIVGPGASVNFLPTIRNSGSRILSVKSTNASALTGIASQFKTVSSQSGTVQLASGTAIVALPTPLPDSAYQVSLTPIGVNESLQVSLKSGTGFTITSSNAGSTASVDWILVR